MQSNRKIVGFILILFVALLSGCNGPSKDASILLELELTENYSNADPFIHEKLFCVSEDIDALELEVSFQMEGEKGTLEIADNESGEAFWSDTWNGDTDVTTFTVPLTDLKKDKEYVVKFTGTKIIYAKTVVSSDNDLVEYRERPQKSN